ncbi:unnamed protein product [Symbiodinium natans]|uniref:Uncharacterized protein n=1 Tax=Symbiodinium natans TaxID=878477 RepID=A0A812L8X7_9DINO|nr:unnamed protein product [Symbiodinium natans]
MGSPTSLEPLHDVPRGLAIDSPPVVWASMRALPCHDGSLALSCAVSEERRFGQLSNCTSSMPRAAKLSITRLRQQPLCCSRVGLASSGYPREAALPAATFKIGPEVPCVWTRSECWTCWRLPSDGFKAIATAVDDLTCSLLSNLQNPHRIDRKARSNQGHPTVSNTPVYWSRHLVCIAGWPGKGDRAASAAERVGA